MNDLVLRDLFYFLFYLNTIKFTMSKRTSSRQSSLSPRSPIADYEDESAAEALNPSKRLKAANGSAVASPGSTTARDPEVDDDEMRDDNSEQPAPAVKKGILIRHKSRSSTRAEDDEADVDEDVGDVTVMHTNGTNGHANSNGSGNTNGVDKKLSIRGSVNNSSGHADHDDIDALSDISEDTDGDVPAPKPHAPNSTYHHLLEEEINNNEPQVTVCAWDGCETGDLSTMDKLVEHLHAEHVEGKQRRYTCEWFGCPRKGKSHASAYALKAHLRSHTREKPHVCLLPECDQAFARQDALNKHMRTAHEIDLMRSFDTSLTRAKAGGSVAGANGSATNGSANGQAGAATNGTKSKLKIIIKTPASHASGHDESLDPGASADEASSDITVLSKEHGFTSREMEMPIKKLYGLCSSQLRWAEDQNRDLMKECAAWEEVYNTAWLEQQVVLDQVIASEKSWYERRKVVLASLAEEEEKRAAEKAARRAEEAAARGEDPKDDDDSAGEGEGDVDGDGDGDDDADDVDGDNDGDDDGDDDDDDDITNMTLDADATQDYSFADATSFSVVGSSLRNEVTVSGD